MVPKKLRRLFHFKYPKLAILLLSTILAFEIFSLPNVQGYITHLAAFDYISFFLAGMLFAFGFSTPFAIGFFWTASPTNIPLAVILGGLGGLVADLFIFRMIKLSFMDEFRSLEKLRVIKNVEHLWRKSFKYKVRMYLLYVFAGIVIASPLPDEFGVSMLAGLTKIKTRVLAIISFIMNSLGILALLLIADAV